MATAGAVAISELRTFVTSVSEVRDVHPELREITVAGGDLTTFAPVGPDTFLYLLLPPPGRTTLTIDQTFSWTAYETMPEADRPVGAYYTVRRWRPEAAEIDLLVVRHGASGPASSWAARAGVGDPVALWGPRTAWDPPAGTDRYVLVADETGLPAVAVILETLPRDARVEVLAETDGAATRQPLPDPGPRTSITWLHRDGRAPGTTALLADAVRSLPVAGDGVYAWGGAESRAMTTVRRHLRDECGLAREQVSMVGYWRHASHVDDPLDDD